MDIRDETALLLQNVGYRIDFPRDVADESKPPTKGEREGFAAMTTDTVFGNCSCQTTVRN